MNEVLRQEKKFLINQEQYYRYSSRLAEVMVEDPHNRGDGYPIRSLYFDSLEDRDFEEKEEGIELRRKIRLRNYGSDSNFAMLEMKQKQGPLQKKRSVRLDRALRDPLRAERRLLESGTVFAQGPDEAASPLASRTVPVHDALSLHLLPSALRAGGFGFVPLLSAL